jgi:hypothetical protein
LCRGHFSHRPEDADISGKTSRKITFKEFARKLFIAQFYIYFFAVLHKTSIKAQATKTSKLVLLRFNLLFCSFSLPLVVVKFECDGFGRRYARSSQIPDFISVIFASLRKSKRCSLVISKAFKCYACFRSFILFFHVAARTFLLLRSFSVTKYRLNKIAINLSTQVTSLFSLIIHANGISVFDFFVRDLLLIKRFIRYGGGDQEKKLRGK